jgi:hypothetical protein
MSRLIQSVFVSKLFYRFSSYRSIQEVRTVKIARYQSGQTECHKGDEKRDQDYLPNPLQQECRNSHHENNRQSFADRFPDL